jgi:hypothetical protein
MADRYWVGGTGTWNTTNTTNWSTSSGGSGGASVPTAADNVFFDQNTTYTVSVTGALACLSLNVSQGTVTFNNATGTPRTLAVSGSFTIKTGTVWSTTATITFNATTSQTITTNGVTLSSSIVIDGAGGTFTLGSALTCGGLTLTNGTFSTSASNYNLTGNITISANSNTKQLDLNASTVTSGFANNSTGNFTLNEGTSTIIITGRSITGTAETFYNISATNPGTFSGNNYSGNTSINGSTFNNGTFTVDNGKTCLITFTGNATFNGTLTTSGTNPWDRILLTSDSPGTVRTITATTRSLTNADFQDITAGGGTAWTGTRLGDGGGNSNITFPAAKTVYFVASGTAVFASARWSTTSGGSTSSANYPLLQDTAHFDENSNASTFYTYGPGINVNGTGMGTLTFANRTTAVTWEPFATNQSGSAWFGDIILSSAVTQAGTGGSVQARPRTTNSINSAGVNLSNVPLNIFADVNNNRDFSISSNLTIRAINHNFGTLKLNSYTITATASFGSGNSNTRTINFGTGKFVLSGTGSVWSTSTVTNLTISGTPTVDITNSTATGTTVQAGPCSESQSIDFNFSAGTYSLTLSGNVKNLNFTGFSGTLNNAARSIYGNLTISSGMTLTAGSNAQTFAATSGSKTITSSGKTFDFPITFDGAGGTWVLQDNLSMGSTRSLTHTNGTLDLNGKTLTVGTDYTTVSGTKNLTFNGGTLVCPNSGATAFNNAQPTNFTTTAGTGTGKISMTSASAKTFVGGGSAYNCTLSNDGAGALTVDGSNTFTTLANGVQPTTFTFTSGTTTTLTNWSISGTSGNLVTIGSTTTSVHTLVKSSGTVNADYLSISYSRATGGATWNAGANSVDGGNNQGWFGIPVTVPGNFFLLFN